MPNCRDIRLYADYNAWFNGRLYAAAATLPAQELAAPRGAFFGSILGTLNHIMVADIMWLKRFAALPAAHPELDPIRALPQPRALDQILHDDLHSLAAQRQLMDETIRRWTEALTEADLAYVLPYRNSKGQPYARRLGDLLLHFFNHQTHHRGQTTTLLMQAGVNVGVTDLLARIPDLRESDTAD